MRKRRRARRNPRDGYTAKQIAWTVAITAITAATGAVVIYYVNKKLQPQGQIPAEEPALDVKVTGQWADATKKLLYPPGGTNPGST